MKEDLLHSPSPPYSQDPVYDYWTLSSNNAGQFTGSIDAPKSVKVLQASFQPFTTICVTTEDIQQDQTAVDQALALPEPFALLHKLWENVHGMTQQDQYFSSPTSDFGTCVKCIFCEKSSGRFTNVIQHTKWRPVNLPNLREIGLENSSCV